MKYWLTFGMSAFTTPGFQDTSRFMTLGFSGQRAYIEPPKSFSSWKQLDGTVRTWRLTSEQNTTILTPPLPIPNRVDALQLGVRLQCASLEQSLRKQFGVRWREETAVYITNWTPQFAPLLQLLRPKHLIFDIVDDVLAFPYSWNRDKVLRHWRSIAAQSSVVLAVSDSLVAHARRDLLHSADYAPNGVNAVHFQTAPTKCPSELTPWQDALCVGFAGTMNHWIDFDAVLALANVHPHVHFFMMGKTGHFGSNGADLAFKRLSDVPNVHFLGAIDYEQLPDYLHAMDILMLPRLQLASSAASSPLKLYEYLAVGKPIITCGVPIPSDLTSLVYASQGPEGLEAEFAAASTEAGNSDALRIKSKMRQAYALERTWEKRVAKALDLLHGAASAKAK